MKIVETFREIPKIIERTIPMVTHFQIVEALQEVVGDDYPNKLMYYDKLKLDELIQFEKRYKVHPANLKLYQARVKLYATYLDKTEKGTCNFMFGKDFNPLMVSKQGEELTVFEKLNISDRLKQKKQ